MDDILFAMLWIFSALAVFVLCMALLEGAYLLLDRFCMPFHRMMERLFASLPHWDE